MNQPKPVVLDLTTELIDNMLIVSPPEDNSQENEESVSDSNSNILDVDYLEFR